MSTPRKMPMPGRTENEDVIVQEIETPRPQYDAIVIGAGVCGIYQSYRLKELGFDFLTIERATDVGGTWHWNRYPGCRFDSESETYAYSFSPELLQEWNWHEHFAPREETEAYLQYVVKKFGLRNHMLFGASVTEAKWSEDSRCWTLGLADGRTFTARFLLTALGFLSTPTLPRYSGVDSFEGTSCHTYFYPREGIDLTGKKVAVIGTGSTGVQLISAIAGTVASLTVFQRRPNWCAPLNNSPISAEEMADIKSRYAQILARCRETPSGYVHDAHPQKLFDVPEEEREAFWEKLYAGSGFGIWLGNYKDVLVDAAANAEFSKYIARKIWQRIKDPAVADKLIPTDHGFGTRRVPMETGYFEVYNQPNVRLVDVGETPIVRVTPKGIDTSAENFDFDVILYATGFDAVTGALEKIDIAGEDGRRLKEKWQDGPQTAYGLAVEGFPNLITLAGPQSGSVFTNFPRGIEEAVDWGTGLLRYLRDNGYDRVEAKEETELRWSQHVETMSGKILSTKQRSWFTGHNSNVERQERTKSFVYVGGAIRYRSIITEEANNGYPGFELSRAT